MSLLERLIHQRPRSLKAVIERLLGDNGWAIAISLFPVVIDVAHWFAFDPINDRLRALLLEPSRATVLALLGIYLAYAVSFIFIGRLKPDIKLRVVTVQTRDKKTGRRGKVRTTWPELLFAYPSFGFGIIMIMGATAVSGMMGDVSALSEGWQQLAVFGATGIFFFHLVVKFIDFEPRYASDQAGYLFTLIPTVLVSELVLNLSAALWFRFLGPEAGAPPPEDPSTLGSFIIAAPLFLIFFAAPRFTFMSKSFTWPALASGVALALWELWEMVAEAPLL